MEKIERAFKGIWISSEIWLDDNLGALDKIIFAEIESLDSEEMGGCIASNKYLAKFCKCSERKIQDSISTLKKLGYIEQTEFNGRIRKLTICERRKKCIADTQKLRGRNAKNSDNNKNNNNTYKKKFKKENKGRLAINYYTDEELVKMHEDMFGSLDEIEI